MTVEGFDSFEEMMDSMRRDQNAAETRVQSWQAAIQPGDYFRSPSGYGFSVYGEVLPEEEPREPDLIHYRFCKCYSIACARGEIGDVHVSTIERLLTQDEFKAAEAREWQP